MAGSTAKDGGTHQSVRGDGRQGKKARTPLARVSVPEPPPVDLDAVDAALVVCAPDWTIVALNGLAAELLRSPTGRSSP
jgi:hypothetical protein